MDLFSHSWLPFLYLYGVGGIFFALGLFIIRRSGSLNLTKPRHSKWLKVLYFGFVWYLMIHGVFTYLALG
ncbi:MAG TPA: hypothetical protein DEA65_03580 [Candidatus Marinimicrobia bacterium]|jgi:hypothetical protein|nr:hypothetical protein [Candidatus Neomarinimicrobiota bacterium]HBR86903.1 hypothetical protein [Candidatus Neomarinimicrobiota bacterium]|tara:strand:- start:539 stop:748 length:210 start_codon:yes stop_codon:yes gene_type:complete